MCSMQNKSARDLQGPGLMNMQGCMSTSAFAATDRSSPFLLSKVKCQPVGGPRMKQVVLTTAVLWGLLIRSMHRQHLVSLCM